MVTLQQLEEKRIEIEQQIDDLLKDERKQALKTVRELCRTHQFTHSMLEKHLAEGRIRSKKKK